MTTEDLIKPDADRSVTDIPEVAQEINAIGQKTITDITDYVQDFIAKRFPGGLPEQLAGIVSDIVLDAFFDGARYAEAAAREESRIIGADDMDRPFVLVGV